MIELEFGSDITFVESAVDLIRTLAVYLGSPEPSRLLVVSAELLRNAVVHGNRNDERKVVTCRLEMLDDRRWRIEVEDRGEGFDPRGVLAGWTTAAAGDCRRGRGYGAIELLSQGVEFSDKGNRVTVYLEA